MRLTIKITFAVLLGVVLIFSVHSYYSIQRERTQLKKNLSRESRHIGESLRVIVTELWQQRGEEAAISFLARANKGYSEALVRWVWIEEDVEQKFSPQVPLSQLEDLHDEVHVTLLAGTEDGRDFLLTYIPLLVEDGRLGAIELSESMDEMHEYVQGSLRRYSLIIAGCVVSGLLLMAVLGSIWIGRPMRKLRAQAERIGTGDFTTSVNLSGSGELAELSSTIERMRGQLEKSRLAEQAATEAKIAALEKLRHTERLATLGQLSAGMAHELGTPLNVISGRAKLIGRGDLPTDDVLRSARIIGEQADRMTTIMRQLLSFARRSEARKQQVDLRPLLQMIEPLIAPTAHNQKVELAIGDNGQSFKVEVDSGQLQQVLLNLCLNGIQAMPEGGRLDLECRCEQATPPETLETVRRDWACVSVCDQGAGIDSEILKQIFDPFFTTKDVGQGTGLGLSIAYGIVEEHGGWIDVKSTVGEGSCFNVYLPLAGAGEVS
jgi:signal transduction histidine kinase